ncbi:MAG: hypothetical protein OHK0053_32350 [Microscillaceae bacterium]
MKANLIVVWALLLALPSLGQYVPPEKREKEKKEPTEEKKEPNTRPQQNPSSELSEQTFWQRLTFSPGIGLSFGNPTWINLYPAVGYRTTEKLTLGLGINYQYLSGRYDIFNSTTQAFERIRYSESFYGGRLFGQYFFIPQIFGWLEVEALNGNFLNRQDGVIERQWVYSPLIGAGYMQSFGRSGRGFFIMILYNLNYNEDESIYSSPWVPRVGFNF